MNWIETLNAWADRWVAVMSGSLVDTAVIFAVVAFLWLALRRRLSAQLVCCLFLLVLVKSLVPVNVTVPAWTACVSPRHTVGRMADWMTERPASAPGVVLPSDEAFNTRAETPPALALHPVAVTGVETIAAPPAPRLSLWSTLMLGWAAIVAMLLVGFASVQWRLVRALNRAPSIDPVALPVDFAHLHRLAGLRRPVRLLATPRIPLPAVWGLFRPCLALPTGLVEELTPQQLSWVLLHELAHIRRRDLWVALFQRLVGIFFFFNPAVWLANWIINSQREYACDDAALAASGTPRRACGEAFLSIIERANTFPRLLAPALGIFNPKDFFKRRLIRMLDTHRPLHTRLTIGSASLLLLVALLVLPNVRAADTQATAERSAQSTTADAADDQPDTNTRGADSSPLAQQTQQRQATLEGRVVAPDGRPMEGARIYLALADSHYAMTRGRGKTQETPRMLGVSAADGTFRATTSRQDAWATHSMLIALGPEGSRFGIDWSDASVFDTTNKSRREKAAKDPALREKWEADRVLHLAQDNVPIDGRIVRPNGEPVVGAKVCVSSIQQMKNSDLTGYLEIAKRGNPRDYDVARSKHVSKTWGELTRRDGLGDLISDITDRDGRFTLHGFGENRAGWLNLEGPGITTQRKLGIFVRSKLGPTLSMLDGDVAFRFYSARFEHTVVESTPVEGTVIDQDSSQPLAGVVIQNLQKNYHMEDERVLFQGACTAITDQNGRYQLRGLPVGEKVRLLASAYDSPHLPSIQESEVPKGKEPARLDWKLKRGVWIEGRVSNAQTDQPVFCDLHYFAFRGNPHVASAIGFLGSLSYPTKPPFATDINGRYRIPGLPGRGIVSVRVKWDPHGDDYPTNKGQENIPGTKSLGMWTSYDTLPSECRVTMYHGVKEVNIKGGETSAKRDFALTPTAELKGRVLDSEGNSLKGFKYAGKTERSWYMFPVDGDQFIVRTYDPTFPRRLLFWHKERKLAGTVVLEGDQRSPIEVTLEPQGSFVGRVVDDNGSPLPGILLVPPPLIDPNPPTTISALPELNYTSGADGRFRIDGVAPGMKYNLMTRLQNGMMRRVVIDAVVDSGKIKDLGDLKLKPF